MKPRSLLGSLLVLLVTLSLRTPAARADEKLAGIACRSVHLAYSSPAARAFYNEVSVAETAAGSYFMVCGWDTGYFGLQELADGRKVGIFSVWDQSAGDNPQLTPQEKRVEVVRQSKDVRVSRFGGEGTGGKCMFDFDWQVGATYRFLVTAKAVGNRTEYAGWIIFPKTNAWHHLVTFSTPNGGKPLRGLYSFVEDFRRNRVSATQPRKAWFGNAWVLSEQNQWKAVSEARFTADSNPALHIDAGEENARFFLATGGETTNTHTKLGKQIQILADRVPQAPPADLPLK